MHHPHPVWRRSMQPIEVIPVTEEGGTPSP